MKNIEQYNKFVQAQNRVEIANENDTIIYPTQKQTRWSNKNDVENQDRIPKNFSVLMKNGPINDIFGDVE